MRRDHFFDWQGLVFAVKAVALCLIAGTIGRYGLLYAAQSHSPTGPSLVLIQEMRPVAKSLSLSLSTTTSAHIINTLSISDAVPPEGKFVVADLRAMVLTLYQDGSAVMKIPIQAKGENGSPYEAPSGFYTVLKKEPDHFNTKEQADLPWSVQFSSNYSIHGSPYGSDGSPLTSSPSISIGLATDDARKAYDFTEIGTNIFVFDPIVRAMPSLTLDAVPVPPISATAYVVADIDTGDVLLDQHAENLLPSASATELMAALAMNEMAPVDAKNPKGKRHDDANLVEWMNAKALALDMRSTRFSDAVGTSTENVSTAEDLFRLASYLAYWKSFILDSDVSRDPTVSVASLPVNGAERRAAIIVLQSKNPAADTTALTDWFTQSAQQGADMTTTACATCAAPPPYRKISL